MTWTEAAISERMNGKFYQLQQKSLGTFVVIDLNAPEPEEPPVVKPVRVVTRVERPRIPRADGSLWMEDIARVVCEVFQVTRLELESIRRNHNIVAARQVFFWLAKKYTSHSFPFIGEWCGRDHTTVMHAVGKIDKQFSQYREKIGACLSRLGVQQQEAA